MRTLILAALVAALTLAGCDEVPTGSPTTDSRSVPAPTSTSTPVSSSAPMSVRQASKAFVDVTRVMEPVLERECRARTRNVNCDFRIVVDDRTNQPSNAYQKLDENGRPIIVFTIALIRDTRNADELAFVLGHEGAHHIEGHIARQQENAIAGAVIFAGLATLSGGNADAVRTAQELGAEVGARTYSKDFELEADRLGTIITKKAGYDPLKGALFFNRIPDPGDKFLGTHPPNAKRLETVRRTAAQL